MTSPRPSNTFLPHPCLRDADRGHADSRPHLPTIAPSAIETPRFLTIVSNHDRWAVRDGRDTSGWDLTERSMAFLEGLPESWTRTIEGASVSPSGTRDRRAT